MSMLNIVSAVSCVFAVICIISFLLFVYQLLRRPSRPAQELAGDRADAVLPHGAIADVGKLVEALAKLTDSLEKASPLIASLIGAMFFMALAALAAGLGK